MEIKIKVIDGKIPTKGYPDSAGYDLYAADDVRIYPLQTKVVRLGFSTEFPREFVALVWDRGGMGIKGVHRFAGVIDADFRGEWCVALCNVNTTPYQIKKGDRVAQVLFQRVEEAIFLPTDTLSQSLRGAGMNASSGR